MAHGQMTHLELPADDPARARKFYEGLFGWEFGEMPEFPNYYLFSFGNIERAGGAIGIRGELVGPQLRLYFEVDSLDATVPKVDASRRQGRDAEDGDPRPGLVRRRRRHGRQPDRPVRERAKLRDVSIAT